MQDLGHKETYPLYVLAVVFIQEAMDLQLPSWLLFGQQLFPFVINFHRLQLFQYSNSKAKSSQLHQTVT